MTPSRTIGLVAVAAIGLLFLGTLAVFLIPRPKPPAPLPKVEAKQEWPSSEVIGSSVQGRSIDAYTYGTGPTRLLFVGGIHGGYEWNSVALAYELMDYLKANPETVPQGLSVTVIPDENPDAVYQATGKEGPITAADAPSGDVSAERFNADGVDLNRNFDCKWQPKSTWQNKTVSAGSAPFSEPESKALRDFVLSQKPAAVVLWHSQANGVYASQCGSGILPGTITLMDIYAQASGYPAIKVFDAYPTTGAAEDWMASIGIPAVTVELSTHSNVEWEKNLAGVRALLSLYGATSTAH